MFDSFLRLSGDSLLIASNQFEHYIAISLIENIAIRKESPAIRNGALIGFVSGIVVGFSLAATVSTAQESGGLLDFIRFAYRVGGTVVGTATGIIVGAYKGKDKIYDMTGWSVAQKKDKIQEIMNGA